MCLASPACLHGFVMNDSPDHHYSPPCRGAVVSQRLCIELWDSFDAHGVSTCGTWGEAGRRPALGSSQAERSVNSEG